MIGAEERRKLVSQFWSDPRHPLIAVLKCLAGLLVLVMISAGPWVLLATSHPPGADSRAVAGTSAAVAESRRVFDERRQAHEATRPSGKLDPVSAAREQVGGSVTCMSEATVCLTNGRPLTRGIERQRP